MPSSSDAPAFPALRPFATPRRSVRKPRLQTAAWATLFAAAIPWTAESATLTICPSGCDETTFQAAADAADPGDTIRLVSIFPHTESGIEIQKDLTIEGVNRFQSIVSGAMNPGSAPDRIFNIFPGHRVTFRNLWIRNGYAPGENGGAIWIQPSAAPTAQVTIESVDITASEAENGGGLYAGTPLVLRDVKVNNNIAAGGDGGGLYAEQTLDMAGDIQVAGNDASVRGGGICIVHPTDASQLDTQILDAFITGNVAGASGAGGLGGAGGSIFNTGKLRISGDSFVQQSEAFAGSGIYHEGPHLLTIEKTQFALNRSDDGTGPAFVAEGGGGGLYLDGPAEIRDSIFLINSAEPPAGAQHGGAILMAVGSSATIERTRFVENVSDNGGGAIAVRGDLILEHSAVYDNEANIGGGLYVSPEGEALITNTTIADNETNLSGGGVYNLGVLRLASSTVAFNHNLNGQGGGLHRGFGATVQSVRSSIIGNNTNGPFATHPDCFGSLNSSSFSLIGDVGPTGSICGVTGITSGMLYNVSPQFSPAFVVDGFASRYEILPSSPAVDSGACASAVGGSLTLDQRYGNRPVDGDFVGGAQCDMGAHEFLPEPGFGLMLAAGGCLAATLRRRKQEAATAA